MDRNYILLPENIQRRPLPGHRHRVKKGKKVSSEAFSPISRAGRRALGEAKGKAATASNARKAEERTGADLAKFVKKLNKILAARPAHPAGEQVELGPTPGLTDICDRGISEGALSQLPQKRALHESSSAGELIETRLAKRARSNAISSSSRVKLEGIPRPPSPINQTMETVSFVGTTEPEYVNRVAQQTLAGVEYVPFENNADLYRLLPADASIGQPHTPFNQLQQSIPPRFSDHGTALPLIYQPNYVLPTAEIPNHLTRLNTSPAPDRRSNDEVHLEHIATACAYAGMGEPMDIDLEFPNFVPHNDHPDLDLEHIAVACAYAAMDEPMDIIEDDTQGPIFHAAPHETYWFNPPAFTPYLPVQQHHFPVGIAPQPQPPMHEAILHAEYQRFIDQDQRLRPPIDVHPDDQFFHPQPAPQELFIMNQTLPLYPPVQAHHNLHAEQFPVAQPFDNAYHPPLAVHQIQDILLHRQILLPPLIHDQLANRQFMPNFPVDEQPNYHLPTQPPVDGGIMHDAGHEGEWADDPVYPQYFVDDDGEDWVAPAANHGGLFAELFGNENGDDDDESEDESDEEEPEIII